MMRKSLFALIVFVLTVLAIVPAAAQDKTEIKVWIAFTDKRLDWTLEKAAQFNAAFPQYNVVVEGYPNYEDLFTATALASEQGTMPAVVQYFEVATQVARDSGYFKSIAEAVGDRTELNGVALDLTDFIQPVIAYYTLDGNFTSMPWNTSSAIMFSNQTMLTAAGVDAIPTTWAEMEAACEKIIAYKDANPDGVVEMTEPVEGETPVIAAVPNYCFTWPNHGWFFEQWLAQENGTFANNDNGRAERATEVAFNSDAGLAVFNWLNDMHDKNYLYYSGATDGNSWGTVDQAFLTGQVAMAMYSSSDTAIYTNTGAANGFDVVASRMPYNQETGWSGNLIGGASLWLSSGLDAAVEDGALTWLFWFTNTTNAAEWHQITGYMPIRQSSVDLLNTADWYDTIAAAGGSTVWSSDPAVDASKGTPWFEANPNFIVASDQIADSTITPATSGALLGDFPAIRTVVTGAIDAMLLTPDADVAGILNKAAEDSNTLLEEYNLLNE